MARAANAPVIERVAKAEEAGRSRYFLRLDFIRPLYCLLTLKKISNYS